jgi:hypothetical protein
MAARQRAAARSRRRGRAGPRRGSVAARRLLDSLERQLWCYAISAKRYCLYRLGRDGKPAVEGAREAPESSATKADHPLTASRTGQSTGLASTWTRSLKTRTARAAMPTAAGSGFARPGSQSSTKHKGASAPGPDGPAPTRSRASRSPAQRLQPGSTATTPNTQTPASAQAASASSPTPPASPSRE